jgi:glycosyltransferase involved in cell wall biosynthesis
MTLRIGIDARLIHYRTGGISTYTRALLRQFAAHPPPDVKFVVLQSRKQPDTLVEGLPHVKLWTPSHHRLEKWALSVELARLRLDVLHSPDFIPPLRGARRHVITVHDLAFLHYPHILTAESRRYYSGQIDWAVGHAHHILTVSEATRQDLITLLGVPAERITVQQEAASPAFKPLDSGHVTSQLRRYRLQRGYLLFVGTIEPRKNIPTLLTAYQALCQRLPDVPPLLLVGRAGWLAEDILHQIADTPGVHHLADAEDSDLPALYNGAAALVLPSHYEGFGLTALEAMACGTLPIVSNRSSMPEVVGPVGLRVDPDSPDSLADALYHALTAPTEWHIEQRSAALARAAHYTWQNAAETALSVYRQVAAR